MEIITHFLISSKNNVSILTSSTVTFLKTFLHHVGHNFTSEEKQCSNGTTNGFMVCRSHVLIITWDIMSHISRLAFIRSHQWLDCTCIESSILLS